TFFPLPALVDDETRKDDDHYAGLVASTAQMSADAPARRYAVAAAQYHTDTKFIQALERLQTEAPERFASSTVNVMHVQCAARYTKCQDPDCSLHHPVRAWWRRQVARASRKNP